MNALRRLPATLTLALFVMGCASPQVNSMRDPAFLGSTYQKVLVLAPFTDPGKKAVAENAFVAQLQTRGVAAIAATVAFPPTRAYSTDEMRADTMKAGTGGVLVLSLIVPYTPGQTITAVDDTTWLSTIRQDPDAFIGKPSVTVQSRIFDVASGATAWLGTTTTNGDTLTNWDAAMNTIAAEAVGKMAADGVVR